MAAVSKAQRRAIAIAEHHPEELRGKNRSLLKMKRSDMHDFASTREKGLPEHVRRGKKRHSSHHRGRRRKMHRGGKRHGKR